MQAVTRTSAPDYWIDQVFSAKAVARGGVIRRSIKWVDREIGRARFFDHVRRRGFHLIRTADQYIVICHNGAVYFEF